LDELMSKKTEDSDILQEAKKRFQACEDWEADFRKRFVEDLKFANADPENGWQWDQVLQQNRTDKRKPCLTINKTRQHNLQIINDAKQNKPGVNIRPVGDGATYEAAQVFEGVVRHIEYQSNAEQAYDTATTFQVEGGIGYWRVITDYVSPDTFDQEIYIRRIKNPDTVYLDPDISEADGSDARFGFIFEDMSRDRFEAEYPDFKGDADLDVIGKGDSWCAKDSVRIAEYYRREQKADKLVAFVDPMTQQQVIIRKSVMDDNQKAMYELVKADPSTNERSVLTDEVQWFKIAGNKIIDRRVWPGKFVPIVRVIGEETVIEGKMDRKGHTRALKDAQRMYNYWTSEGTAQVALQTQTPYIAAVEATEGVETYWAKSNLDDAAYLPYNAYSEDGTRSIPPPQRTQPPQMASAYIDGMRICENQLMMASGQYQSQFGQNENATSGKAINERQRQGDNATYHYIDNLAIGIKYTGKILIDLIPKIYDTPRVIRILAKDGTEGAVQIDPNAQQAHQPTQDPNQEAESQIVSAIFNPNVGRYEIESDTGPGYATRRQEAFNAMTQIASQDKGFLEKAGDLYWKAADFPMADELAERYANAIPAAIKGKGPPPEVQQLQGQLQQSQDAIVKLQKQLDEKDREINIRAYEAESKRITAIGNSGPAITTEQIQPLIRQALVDMLTGGSPEGTSAQGQQMPAEQPQAPQQPPMGQPMPDQTGMQQ
jgi:hypothetical protein